MMDVPSPMFLLLLLLLVAPSLAVVQEFFLVQQPMSWTDAQSHCKSKMLDLVTVGNQDDWNRVKDMLGGLEAWIGLYDDVNSWRWALDNTSLYQDGTTTLESWFSMSVDNAGGQEYCAYMVYGKVTDGLCSGVNKFLCYDEPTDTHHPIWDPLTWWDARSFCQATYTDLASVRSEAELNVIKGAYNHYGWWWWLGLTRESWAWSDRSGSLFRAWAAGQPGGGRLDCVYAGSAGWINDACVTPRPFICSTPVYKLIKVVLKVNSGVDPNDPQIRTAILNQRRDTLLTDGSVNKKLALSWREDAGRVVFNRTDL